MTQSTLSSLAASAILLATSSLLSANVIVSVNISRSDGSEDLTAGQIVGAAVGEASAAVGNWNNVLSPSTTATTFTTGREVTGWQDSTGATVSDNTGFSFFLHGNGGDIGNGDDGAPTRLQRNGPRVQGWSSFALGAEKFQLLNTAAIFGTGTFDLYVYGANPTTNDRTLTLQISGTDTQQLLTMNRNDINDSFDEGVDYLVFTGLTATAGAIAFDMLASGTALGFGGFQMVGGPLPIPEPSTYAMIGSRYPAQTSAE